MESKFKIGDKVRIIVDSVAIYVVKKVKKYNGYFFYNIENKDTFLTDISEVKLEKAQ